jgi:hypothetical protein
MVLRVSNKGRIEKANGLRVLPGQGMNGYRHIIIDGKGRQVHRLVCRAFNGPAPTTEHLQVDHIDNDPGNNDASNLRWCTRSENMQRTISGRKSNAPKRSKPLFARPLGSKDDFDWVRYSSSEEAARELGGSSGGICLVLNGKGKSYKGYEYMYDTGATIQLLPGEEWKQVNDSKACVSSMGRFKSTFGVISYPDKNTDGGCTVIIGKKQFHIHRLICRMFNGDPPDEFHTDVNHIDRDRANNRADNLQWTTRSANIQHSYDTNKTRKSSGLNLSMPVLARPLTSGEDWQIFESTLKAAAEFNTTPSHVSAVCLGKRRHAKGVEFKYEEQGDWEGEEWRTVVLC